MTARKILVTGAGGFVGRHLVRALRVVFRGAKIIAAGRQSGMDLILSVTDREAVFKAFSALQPDICIHLAAIAATDTARADPGRAWAVNLHGALNVADAILAEAPHCRLIFASSADCYGASFFPGVPVDETAALAPLSLYAATKAAADLALGAMAPQGLRLLRLRLFNHTGPGQLESFVVPTFAGQIARIEARLAPPEIAVGALHAERDFLDIRDVCAAYVACIERSDDLPRSEILNISSGQPVRIATILEKLMAKSATAIKIRPDPAKLRPIEVPRVTGSSAKARALLNWRPNYDLDECLGAVLEHARRANRSAMAHASVYSQ